LDIFAIPCFDFVEYVALLESRVSIIAINCWGGYTYSSLHHEFLSPFINMYLTEEEYIKLLENFDWYMEQDLIFKEEIFDELMGVRHPVGLLGDVSLYLNHYDSFEMAYEKWGERKNRINKNNLFVMMYTCDKSVLERFAQLPFEKKVCFVPFESDVPCAVDISAYNSKIGNDMSKLYENVNGLAQNWISGYNVIKLLKGDNVYMR